MDLLRKFIILVIIGIFFVSVVIGFIFFIINKCLSKRGRHRISQLQKRSNFKAESNKYHIKDPEAAIPPLPPRTQFLTAEAQSYENLAEGPEYEQDKHDYEQDKHDYEEENHDYEEENHEYEEENHDYEQDKHDYEEENHDYEEENHDYEEDIHDYEETTDQQPDYVVVEDEVDALLSPPNMILAQSYENLAGEADYVQGLDEQPDYVKVEDEVNVLLSPPLAAGPAGDSASEEEYDDIGDENQDEEDYDDVA